MFDEKKMLSRFLLVLVCVLCNGAIWPTMIAQASTVLVSRGITAPGTEANGNSVTTRYSFSADGTKVAFQSFANHLVNGDTNNANDIFVHDLTTHVTSRVSVSSSGAQGNAASENPCLSADGTKVAFESLANNLVSGDTSSNAKNIFVRDLITGVTTLASVHINAINDTNPSISPCLSADGTKVAFASWATNLVNDDTNVQFDIFVRDLTTGVTTRVSMGSGGVQSNGHSYNPSLSADGNKVAFSSIASNLVLDDSNDTTDVFVRDLSTGTTIRASVDSQGTQGNSLSYSASLSADGTKVAFNSAARNLVVGDSNANYDIFVHDLTTGVTTRVSVDNSGVEGNGQSFNPSLNADGSKVAFESTSSNLVSGGDTNGTNDVFVRDLTTNVITRGSVNSSGVGAMGSSENASLNGDGTKIVFQSTAINLVSDKTSGVSDVFVRDLNSGIITRLSLTGGNAFPTPSNGSSSTTRFSFSADGTKVAFVSAASNMVVSDTNNLVDIFVRDLTTNITTRVSVSSSGVQGNGHSFNPSLSADGTKVAFASDASNLVADDSNGFRDVFVHDLTSGETILVSLNSRALPGNNHSSFPSISADGTKVAFQSLANNIVSGDTNSSEDIFVRDLTSHVTSRVSLGSSGVRSNSYSQNPSISADGSKVAFASFANNLVANDTNGAIDVFVRDMATGVTTRVSVDSNGIQGNYPSTSPSISADGSKVAFESTASNFVEGDSTISDIFVHDLTTGATTLISRSKSGATNNYPSTSPSISADGTKVAFESRADGLVENDTNGNYDIFLRSMTSGITVRLSVDNVGRQGFGASYYPSISGDGKKVAFSSAANLVGETDGYPEVYVSNVPVFVHIEDVSVIEGTSVQGSTRNARLAVRLSEASSQTITVDYATANGITNPAKSGSDYIATTGTLTFNPGATTATISVPIIGDAVDEVDETFFVNFSRPVNATLTDTRLITTILDDDRAPAVSIDDVTVTEGNPPSNGSSGTVNATFTVTLSALSAQTVSVNAIPYNGSARAPGDYVSGGVRLVFNPGEISKTFSVPVKGDLHR